MTDGYTSRTFQQRLKDTVIDRYIGASRAARILVFAVVGASGIPVDWGITSAGIILGVHYLVANVIGYSVAVTWNFYWNYRVTWGRPDKSFTKMYGQYVGADVIFFGFRAGIVAGLVEFGIIGPIWATLIAILVVAALTFVVADEVVFNES